MKKHAKILSLFIALFMLFALALPTLAYETDGNFSNVTPDYNPGPPQDVWSITRVFHWVVRGENLDAIAAAYGTTPEAIRDNNKCYFDDLALRNWTRYTDKVDANMELENGVRLLIYDLLTVRHYVVRGDTLMDLAGENVAAGGTLALYDDFGVEIFRMKTTVKAVRNENADWFRNLDLLNITQDEYIPLMESNNIFAYYSGLVINKTPSNWDSWDINGSPLYITVPVQIDYVRVPNAARMWIDRVRADSALNWTPYDWTLPNEVFYSAIAYKANTSEDRIAAAGIEGACSPVFPLIPEQRIYGNTIPPENPAWTYNVGWTQNVTNLGFYIDDIYLPVARAWKLGAAPFNWVYGELGINKIRNLKMEFYDNGGEYIYGSNPALLWRFGEAALGFGPFVYYQSLRTGTQNPLKP